MRNLISSAVSFVSHLGFRVLVHITSILGATFLLGGVTTHSALWATIVWFSCYLGLICLFPQKKTDSLRYFLSPCYIGIAQIIILCLCGIPLSYAVFWGGAQTWIQRMLQRQENPGWQWVTLPWLVLTALGLITLQPDETIVRSAAQGYPFNTSDPYWAISLISLGALTGITAFASKIYNWLYILPKSKKNLQTILTSLQSLNSKNSIPLPEPLQLPVKELTAQLTVTLQQTKSIQYPLHLLINDTRSLLNQLHTLQQRSNPQAWDQEAGQTATAIKKLQQKLRDEVLKKTPLQLHTKVREPGINAPLAEKTEYYLAVTRNLTVKLPQLPHEWQTPLAGIIKHAEEMLISMQDEAQEAAATDRFLAKFLKPAQTIVDEYVRANGKKQSTDAAEVKEKGQQVLCRLETAFQEEFNSLSRNDSVNFTAELNVLDKLLKMEGR